MKNKKTKFNFMWVFLVIAVAGLSFLVMNYSPTQGTSIDGSGAGVCFGISSVNLLFDDQNFYKTGTDPASHVTVYEKNGVGYSLILPDDASSDNAISGNSDYKAIIGTNGGTPIAGYFSELAPFSVECQDYTLQTPKLKPSGAPTITIINDNGVTPNSDDNHESMSASSTYSPKLTIKAPAEACSSRHGAYIIADYDATYFNTLDTADLSLGTTLVLLTHNSPTVNLTQGDNEATNDQFKVWLYNGELCNGASISPQIAIKTTATEPTEDMNVDFYWISRDIDVDADNGYIPLPPAIYDEDNNAIYDVYTNQTYFTA